MKGEREKWNDEGKRGEEEGRREGQREERRR